MGLIILIVVIFAGGWAIGRAFEKMALPAVLGMTILGVVLSYFVKSELPLTLWIIAPILQALALVIILLRAGLGINRETLKKIGMLTLTLGLFPCLFEGFTYVFLFKALLGFSWVESGAIGFILAAVSPAVVIPSMLDLKERGYGKKKEIPTTILAAASIDDVFAITLFSVFSGIYLGSELNLVLTLFSIPLKLFLGAMVGLVVGFLLVKIYKVINEKYIIKVILLIAIGYGMLKLGEWSSLATLFGLMLLGYFLLEKLPKEASKFSVHLNKIWKFAQIALFVLIGLQVDVSKLSDTGILALVIIAIGLLARSLGVWLSVCRSKLNAKEKIFTIMSYTPKATVQAVMGSVPLAMGMANGEEMLAISVLSIIVTAPLGLILIRHFGPKLLEKES